MVGQNLDDGEDGEGDDGAASDQVSQHLRMSASTKLPQKKQSCHQNHKMASQNNKSASKHNKIAI